jgi:chitin disaccharide deacetylase
VDSHRDVHRDPNHLGTFLDLAHCWGIPLRGSSEVRRLSRFYGQWAGESHPEQVGVESLSRMLASDVTEGVTELICHPGYPDAQLVSSYAREREVEIATLCDPRIRSALDALAIELTNHEERGRLAENPR